MSSGSKSEFCVRNISVPAEGTGWYDASPMQGMSALDERAGADEWQTSRDPISANSPLQSLKAREGGIKRLRPIALTRMTACHFMQGTIKVNK